MKKLYYLLIASITISIIVFVFSFSNFSTKLTQELSNSTNLHLTEISLENAKLFQAKISDQCAFIKTLAVLSSNLDFDNTKDVIEFASQAVLKSGFDRIVIHTKDGKGITSDGILVDDVTKQDFFIGAMKGKTTVYPLFLSPVGDREIIILSTPIYKNNENIGVLTASYRKEIIDEVFNLSFFDGKGYGYVVDSSGQIILKSQNKYSLQMKDNIFVGLEKYYPNLVKQIGQDLKNKTLGIASFSIDKNQRILCYSPLEINDWSIFSIIPFEIISVQANIINSLLLKLTVVILISISFVFIIFAIIGQKSKKLIADANAATLLSEKRYRFATEQSSSVVFEYNYEDMSNIFSNNCENIFGYTSKDLLMQEDYSNLRSLFSKLGNDNHKIETDVKIKKMDNTYIWCRIRATKLFDHNNKPIKVIGTITDIDEEKKESDLLTEKAQRDPLTRLYNKVAGQLEIDDIIHSNKNQLHAILAIDIDNFKEVNDNLGHLFGDKILCEVATKMKSLFRSTDVLCRFGGDEFIVFMRGISSEEFAIEKAISLLNSLKNNYTNGKKEYNMSASIGISLFSKHGVDFIELYRNADIALYRAKKNGKNSYCLYS